MAQKLRRIRVKPLGYVLLGLGFLLLGISIWYISTLFTEAVRENPASRASSQLEAANMLSQAAVSDPDGYSIRDWETARFQEGSLILVNGEHGTKDAKEEDLITLYGNKSDSYQVKDTLVSLRADVLPHLNSLLDAFQKAEGSSDILALSGFRDAKKQKELYDADLAGSGRLYSDQTAKPGYSEHETGYAMDFSLYTKFGRTLDYDGKGKYEWIEENACRYGFIRRYSEEKREITHTIDEPWHYRFVGYPHALLIKAKNFCLEEYIDYLHGFPFDGNHLFVDDGAGKKYEIYYVKASGEETTRLPIPSDRDYEVSGDNVDGFIVTAVA